MKKILSYIWQLPQNLLGLLLVKIYKAEQYISVGDDEAMTYISKSISSGISLGRYIIVTSRNKVTIAHEYGHTKQSQILGWLYLPVVGLWSCIRAYLHLYENGHYYDAYPENWADKLGGVKRDKLGRRYAR